MVAAASNLSAASGNQCDGSPGPSRPEITVGQAERSATPAASDCATTGQSASVGRSCLHRMLFTVGLTVKREGSRKAVTSHTHKESSLGTSDQAAVQTEKTRTYLCPKGEDLPRCRRAPEPREAARSQLRVSDTSWARCRRHSATAGGAPAAAAAAAAAHQLARTGRASAAAAAAEREVGVTEGAPAGGHHVAASLACMVAAEWRDARRRARKMGSH